MEKTITIHQAEVETFTVQVKVITVNNRKMTLSVFRQLEKRNFVHHNTLKTQGEIWGRVNYHWDGCGGDNEAKHQHIVWQEGESIYRDCFGDMKAFQCWRPTSLDSSYRSALIYCGVLLSSLEERPKFWDVQYRTEKAMGVYGFSTMVDYQEQSRVETYWKHKEKEHVSPTHDEVIEQARGEVFDLARDKWDWLCKERFGADFDVINLDDIKAETTRVNKEMSEKKSRYAEAIKKVEEAPHLFIAV